jgi:hypothetical protein
MPGTLVITTLSDGTNSTSATNCIQGSAKAWVNFNGLTGSGNTIRASYNVSSITRNGTGNYTVTLTNALSDVNYAVVASCRLRDAFILYGNCTSKPVTSSTAEIRCGIEDYNSGEFPEDAEWVSVSFFR